MLNCYFFLQYCDGIYSHKADFRLSMLLPCERCFLCITQTRLLSCWIPSKPPFVSDIQGALPKLIQPSHGGIKLKFLCDFSFLKVVSCTWNPYPVSPRTDEKEEVEVAIVVLRFNSLREDISYLLEASTLL